MSWSVVGQPRAVASLERSLKTGRLAHAYLLSGPEHVGRARLAQDLAKAIECVGADPPCGACRPCRLVEDRKHPDVEWVSVGGLCDQSDHAHQRDGSKDIKICQVRRLERLIMLSPFEGKARVVIIDPADALNIYAADALLKTLEEPPEGVVLILVARDPESLPQTVVSRARVVALGPVPLLDIQNELARRGVGADRAALLAQLSEGRIGWALESASDDALADERERCLDEIERIARAGRAERMRLAADIAARYASNRDRLIADLNRWETWWRDLLLAHEGCDDLVANRDRVDRIRALVRSVSAAGVIDALVALGAYRRQIGDNVNTRLALEVLCLRLPGPLNGEEVEREEVASAR
jgi:DNA polymerase III subunit delta'